MLGYAIEVYKKECTGVLLGDIMETANKIIVNSAVALQSAERGVNSVQPKHHRYQRIDEVLSFSSLDWIVGEFHSHTDSRGRKPSYRLSPEDCEYIYKHHHDGEVELVMAIRRTQRDYPWDYIDQDRVLSGTIGDYFFQLAAYSKENENDTGTLTEIWCPIEAIIHIAQEFDMAPKPGYIFGFIPREFHRGRFRKLVRLIRKYEEKVIQKADEDAGMTELAQIKLLMKELSLMSNLYL
jgi:hypothetical protein